MKWNVCQVNERDRNFMIPLLFEATIIQLVSSWIKFYLVLLEQIKLKSILALSGYLFSNTV